MTRSDRGAPPPAAETGPFSQRSAVELAPNRLAVALAAARGRALPLSDLTVSNPTEAGIPYAQATRVALAEAATDLAYEPAPFGLATARDAVATLWRERGLAVDPGHVVLTASTSEAYAYAFKLFCDPGDEVLVPAPSYPLFEHLARLEGVTPMTYRLGFDGAWFLDVAEVERVRTPRARAIVVVSPNNPTGSFLDRAGLERLGALGLPLISDEVFGEYALGDDPRRAKSALESAGLLTVALDGLSKVAALPQAKLAWMTLGGEAPLVEQALARLEVVADTFLSPGTAVQRALPALLASRGTARDAIRARSARNVAQLAAACAGSPISVLPVEGGWYAVLRLPATLSDEEWSLLFLAKGVLVQPGYFFDFIGPPHAVVSLLTPEDVLERAIGVIVEQVSRA